MGPTAIGKTDLALAVAQECNCEIIGVDSMQIYKFMDIGTAKPTLKERQAIPHHLIDYVYPDEHYSAARFVKDCQQAIEKIRNRGKNVLLAGGTGLYFRALIDGIFDIPDIEVGVRENLQQEHQAKGLGKLYEELLRVDPESAARIHANDSYRIHRALEIFRGTGKSWSSFIREHAATKKKQGGAAGSFLKIGLERERKELYRRIEKRCEIMVTQGLLAEVTTLLEKGYAKELSSMQSLGYRHMVQFIDGEYTWEKCLELLARDTRRYAKRQRTWFKRDTDICWFHPDMKDQIIDTISAFLKSNEKDETDTYA